MAAKTLPHFSFPHRHPTLDSFFQQPPRLMVDTDAASCRTIQGLDLTTKRRMSKPEITRTLSSPPTTPTRSRAYTEGPGLRTLHDSGAITPPPTPTKAEMMHRKKDSIEDGVTSMNIKREDSITSDTPLSTIAWKPLIDEKEKPGSTSLKEFPYWISDYKIPDKKKPLGSGLWSDVYFAVPTLPSTSPTSPSTQINPRDTTMTPPLTPVKPQTSNLTKDSLPTLPPAYAIKTPALRSATQVLTEEAKILSYLSRFPNASKYIVPFYGQDTRTNSLVLRAMDTTLDSWLTNTLDPFPEPARTEKLARIFPDLAVRLIEGLEWIVDKGVVHADIKPANILLSFGDDGEIKEVLYSDFSSAMLSSPSSLSPSPSPSTPTPNTSTPSLGGGTWDFLDPILLSRSRPSSPDLSTETWSLAMTLLTLILGSSPYDCAGSNQFRKREFVKQGNPLAYVGYGDFGPRNLERLRGLGGVARWLGGVLVREQGKRVGLGEWRTELGAAVGKNS